MKAVRNLFLVGLVVCLGFGALSAVDKPWHPGQTYIIPDDGFTYTLDWSYSLTDDLLISGTLKILSLTDNVVALTNDSYQITIETDGVLTLTAGWGTNGQDYADGGADGVNGKDVWLVNNGTITVDGIFTVIGGRGGDGGNGNTSGNGGSGGNAGSIFVIGVGLVSISNNGSLVLSGGTGGTGGDAVGAASFKDGGAGGIGGVSSISDFITIIVLGGGRSALNGGAGGDGGSGGDGEGSSGGTSGSGGSATMNVVATIIISNGGSLNLNGGVGGNGGDGGDGGGGTNLGRTGGLGGNATIGGGSTIFVDSNGILSLNGGDGGGGGAAGSSENSNSGGDGDVGGAASITGNSTIIATDGGTLNLNGGVGGDGGTGAVSGGSAGVGAVGGDAKFISTATTVFEDNSTVNMTGGNGGDPGASSGGAGGDGGASAIDSEKKVFVDLDVDYSTVTVNLTDGTDGTGTCTTAGQGYVVKGLAGNQFIADRACGALSLWAPEQTLSQQASLNQTWTIDYNRIIHGNGNKIVLGESGEIVIDDGANVLFENLTIEGLTTNNLRCLDYTTTITFNNVTLSLDGDFSFTNGSLNVWGDCYIEDASLGDYLEKVFEYSSDQLLTINPNATLHVSPEVIFDYQSSSDNLIKMSDATSTFALNRSKLLATENLTLATGVLSTEDLVILEGNPGTLSLDGLSSVVVGDGIVKIGNVTPLIRSVMDSMSTMGLTMDMTKVKVIEMDETWDPNVVYVIPDDGSTYILHVPNTTNTSASVQDKRSEKISRKNFVLLKGYSDIRFLN